MISNDDWNDLKAKELCGMFRQRDERIDIIRDDLLEFIEQTQFQIMTIEKRLDAMASRVNELWISRGEK